MTLSVWRFGHLTLALVTSIFLLVASVTGVILACEPITHQSQGYAEENLDEVTLAETIAVLSNTYDEVFSVEIEPSDFVKASVLTDEFEMKDIYVNPKTGAELGVVAKKPFIYSFATTLHRSLFLKSMGRFFVGLVSALLFLIGVTGMFLLAQRQGGIKRLFSKVQKDYFELRYHVILSRWLFLPILIVALTGAYLSAEKFNLLPKTTLQQQKNEAPETSEIFKSAKDLPILKGITLNQVRKVDFPFSDDPEDYFKIALQDKEIEVNQQTGAIVSSASYPMITLVSRLSLNLHTGQGSVWWSVVLWIASASLLFFMYSGFVMFFKRRKKTSLATEMLGKDECEFVILVGSETGTALDFSRRLYNALTKAGKNVFMTELNKYTTYAKATDMIVITSTYGEGEPPTNARKFESLFTETTQPQKLNYSVVGLGSLEYPDYCEFAAHIEVLFQENENFKSILPLYKINQANFLAFEDWAKQWSNQMNLSLRLERPAQKKKKLKTRKFKVVERTDKNEDDTFILRLKPKRRLNFSSGDLLSVFPNENTVARQYSIAKFGKEIVLSVKKHEFGLGSSFLFNLQKGDSLKAALELNDDFHFPKKTNSAVLIANGTGIAPFLGMIAENPTTEINLFWGGRTKGSAKLYQRLFKNNVLNKPKVKLHQALSREGDKNYVQVVLLQQQDRVLNTLENDGVIMICGSLAMQRDVLDSLEKMINNSPSLSLDEIENQEQLKMDCY